MGQKIPDLTLVCIGWMLGGSVGATSGGEGEGDDAGSGVEDAVAECEVYEG